MQVRRGFGRVAGMNPIDVAGQDAALLSAVEVGLGSLLHAFRVPLTGQFLSLNQIFMLSRSSLKLRGQRAARTIGFQISLIAALLKSLAPAGKKLTPMLAIAMQGLLFSLGTIFFGANAVGLAVGAFLSALWAYAQPALILLLLFGSSLVDVAKYFLDKTSEAVAVTPENLLRVLLALVGLKILLAWACVIAALWLPESFVTRFQKRLLEIRPRAKKSRPQQSLAAGALSDMLNPLFLLSFLLTILFFVFVDSTWSQMIWGILRPLAIGFLFFYAIRWLPLKMRGRWLEWKPLQPLVEPFRVAYNQLTAIDKN